MRFMETAVIAIFTLAFVRSWFGTDLAPHFFGVLKNLGFKFKWTPEGSETRFHDEWFTWLNVNYHDRLWAELISCPVCFSWHVGFWFGLVMLLTGGITPLEYIAGISLGVVLVTTLGEK